MIKEYGENVQSRCTTIHIFKIQCSRACEKFLTINFKQIEKLPTQPYPGCDEISIQRNTTPITPTIKPYLVYIPL